jgi:hypothetical protein
MRSHGKSMAGMPSGHMRTTPWSSRRFVLLLESTISATLTLTVMAGTEAGGSSAVVHALLPLKLLEEMRTGWSPVRVAKSPSQSAALAAQWQQAQVADDDDDGDLEV